MTIERLKQLSDGYDRTAEIMTDKGCLEASEYRKMALLSEIAYRLAAIHEVDVAKMPAAPAAIQYRCLWYENCMVTPTTPDGIVYLCGVVTTDFQRAKREAEAKCGAHNYHGVMVEAREASTKEWWLPWKE